MVFSQYSQEQFDRAVWGVVSGIKPGHVMSYGEVARAAGYPRHARMVSKAMSRSTKPLPWYRVVKADRSLAFNVGSQYYLKQKSLLEEEGAQLINGKVVPVAENDSQDLDKLLWGPVDS